LKAFFGNQFLYISRETNIKVFAPLSHRQNGRQAVGLLLPQAKVLYIFKKRIGFGAKPQGFIFV
jgi:hypothetical protein